MRRGLLVIVVSAAAAVVALPGALLSGMLPVPGVGANTRPPCRQLPSAQAVGAALAEHAATTGALTSAVPGVRVSMSRPCTGQQADRALIRITVPDDGRRAAVDDWLGSHDGYGVPLEVVTS